MHIFLHIIQKLNNNFFQWYSNQDRSFNRESIYRYQALRKYLFLMFPFSLQIKIFLKITQNSNRLYANPQGIYWSSATLYAVVAEESLSTVPTVSAVSTLLRIYFPLRKENATLFACWFWKYFQIWHTMFTILFGIKLKNLSSVLFRSTKN